MVLFVGRCRNPLTSSGPPLHCRVRHLAFSRTGRMPDWFRRMWRLATQWYTEVEKGWKLMSSMHRKHTYHSRINFSLILIWHFDMIMIEIGSISPSQDPPPLMTSPGISPSGEATYYFLRQELTESAIALLTFPDWFEHQITPANPERSSFLFPAQPVFTYIIIDTAPEEAEKARSATIVHSTLCIHGASSDQILIMTFIVFRINTFRCSWVTTKGETWTEDLPMSRHDALTPAPSTQVKVHGDFVSDQLWFHKGRKDPMFPYVLVCLWLMLSSQRGGRAWSNSP